MNRFEDDHNPYGTDRSRFETPEQFAERVAMDERRHEGEWQPPCEIGSNEVRTMEECDLLGRVCPVYLRLKLVRRKEKILSRALELAYLDLPSEYMGSPERYIRQAKAENERRHEGGWQPPCEIGSNDGS